jgi:hypothetical protein
MPSSIRLAPPARAAASAVRAPVDFSGPGATPGKRTGNGVDHAWRRARP